MNKVIFLNILAVALAFASCRKSDNPEIPELTRVPVPNLILKDGSDDQISPANPAGFNAEFDVDVFFKDDIPPQKFDVVVIKNGDKGSVKVLKSDITTFPTTVAVSGQQLIDFYGEIEDGDAFTVGGDVTTQNVTLLQAIPPV
ncbi:MAG: hypothetical protein ACTHLE_16795 [Agriterribacter sp.]